MSAEKGLCPLTTRQIVDEYFVENRNRLIELAAFLDRLDRSTDQADPGGDFRVRAIRKGLATLAGSQSSRVLQLQMLFSDPTTAPRESLDQKSAKGAWDETEVTR